MRNYLLRTKIEQQLTAQKRPRTLEDNKQLDDLILQDNRQLDGFYKF